MRRFILVGCALAAWASAQAYRTLVTPEQVADVVRAATVEVLISADTLHSRAVADALREAMTVRGVPVYVLAAAEGSRENASYLSSLALAGASVRLAPVGGSVLVIDRRVTIAGPLVGELGLLDGSSPTLLVDDEAYARAFVEGFVRGFEAGEPFTPRVGAP